MFKYILTYCFLVFSQCTIAQSEKMETDRPGKTNTPTTILNKWLQTEIGFQKETYRFQPVLKDLYFQIPTLLTKYGIGNRFEVRLITEFAYVKEENVNGNSTYKAVNNTQFGGKFNFLKEKGIIPKTSIIAHYSFNILNTNAYRDSINGGNIRLAMLHNISENFLLVYNIGVQKRSWKDETEYLYTLSSKFNIAEKWQAFIEIYGFLRKGRLPQTSIDAGVSYYINNNFKIDATAGSRINQNTKLKFYSVGASFRFKTSKNDS